MKINVEVDCTPEEARRFMGLPDLSPVHAAYVDQMTKAVSEGVTPDMIETMVRNWGSLGDAGLGLWKQMFSNLGSLSSKSSSSSDAR